jgi:small neutral amino acid transporter SnatA (MarC family)
VRAFVIAVIAVVVGGFLGRALAENWSISDPALLLSGEIIFALVGLSLVNSPDAAQTANVLAIVLAVMVCSTCWRCCTRGGSWAGSR